MIGAKLRDRIRQIVGREEEREETGIIVGARARNVSVVATERGVLEVLNTELPHRPGLPVRIRRDGGAWRVVGIDHIALPDPGQYHYVPAHAEAHRFNHPTGGDDVVWICKEQYTPLLVAPTDPPSLSVRVLPGTCYNHSGELVSVSRTEVLDLSQHIGSVTLYALIAIDLSTGAPVVARVSGSYPTVAPGEIPLAIVRLQPGATSIGWREIYDARDLPPSLGAVALSVATRAAWIARVLPSGEVRLYPPTPAGLESALSEASAGDLVRVPYPLVLDQVSVPQGVIVDLGFSSVRSISLAAGAAAASYVEQ